ncbi:hypothetical protein BEWA_010090 [Theileria equi strain WA]|uniref:Uncharacterized protein n=1 Tax=Theileria equi strain WA TaxID=1537102 RepID=L0B190_THEEQ|nr:hypothetical protein BEWA_010090 [Theileria equi strain WA]AFZ81595.1 hypothetical protein BEWA_010090 [Theileria equi strain WA]|eukprot:XP_004831261.1 hypothetical protein BEWA_010090 [Theileria equi strain WA]
MNLKDLKTLALQRGLLITPFDRESIVIRLILYDIYWSEKFETKDTLEKSNTSDHEEEDDYDYYNFEKESELVPEPRVVEYPPQDLIVNQDLPTENAEEPVPESTSPDETYKEHAESIESNDEIDIFAV